MKNIFISLVCTLWCLHLFGQSIEPAGFISNSAYYSGPASISLHTSFGEIATERIVEEDQSTSLTQGFLQTYFPLVPTENVNSNDLIVTVGPNPFISEFSIQKSDNDQLTANLIDLNGRVVYSCDLVDEKTIIDLSELPSASYFLSIHDDEKQIFNTYKLIKL